MRKEHDHTIKLANSLTIKGSFTVIGTLNKKDLAQLNVYVVCANTGFYWSRVLHVPAAENNSAVLVKHLNQIKDRLGQKGIDALQVETSISAIRDELNAFCTEHRQSRAI